MKKYCGDCVKFVEPDKCDFLKGRPTFVSARRYEDCMSLNYYYNCDLYEPIEKLKKYLDNFEG